MELLERSPARWWFICAFCGLLVGQIVGLFAAMAATSLSGYHGSLQSLAQATSPPAVYVAFSLIGLWVGFAIGPIVASSRFGTRRFGADLGLRARPIDLLGIPIGLVSVALVAALNDVLFHNNPGLNGPAHRLTASFHGSAALLIAALTVIGAPFF